MGLVVPENDHGGSSMHMDSRLQLVMGRWWIHCRERACSEGAVRRWGDERYQMTRGSGRSPLQQRRKRTLADLRPPSPSHSEMRPTQLSWRREQPPGGSRTPSTAWRGWDVVRMSAPGGWGKSKPLTFYSLRPK